MDQIQKKLKTAATVLCIFTVLAAIIISRVPVDNTELAIVKGFSIAVLICIAIWSAYTRYDIEADTDD